MTASLLIFISLVSGVEDSVGFLGSVPIDDTLVGVCSVLLGFFAPQASTNTAAAAIVPTSPRTFKKPLLDVVAFSNEPLGLGFS